MQTAAGSARVGTRRVRALLDGDRRAANEVRPELEDVRLDTAEYIVPLRMRLKRSFREDDRVRLWSLVLSVGVSLVLLGSLTSTLTTARASHDEQDRLLAATEEPLHQRGLMPVVSHRPAAAPAPASAPAIEEVAAPRVRDRLQRARRVLRISGGAEGAAKARTLLEELVHDRPKHGRAYATLAEACLRLSDASCAREAVTKAVARQPRRAKYRALAGRIERAFASGED